MGGAAKTLGSVVGTVADIGLMGTNPGLAIAKTIGGNILTNAFAGGGGGDGGSPSTGGGTTPQYALPDFNYGANTYTLNNNPYDASKYFITGDKGVYNMMPQLGNLYGDSATNKLPGATSYNIYNSIYNKMADDAKAQAAFAQAYGPKTFTPTIVKGNVMKSFTGPNYLKGDIRNAYQEQRNAYNTANRALPKGQRPAFAPTPIQYSDFGFSKNATTMDNPLEALANYATTQKNPFFVPFAPTTPTTTTTPVNPVGANTNPGQYQPVNVREGGIIGLLKN